MKVSTDVSTGSILLLLEQLLSTAWQAMMPLV
jgi:hypothetical protein